MRMDVRFSLGLMIAVVLGATTARADTALVAAASNFADAATELVDAFETSTPHRLTITLGSTGKLYAQIRAGAPFDVFLAADQERPLKLVDGGLAVPTSRFTYAVGQLSLWSANKNFAASKLQQALTSPAAVSIALANPELAPYGTAARQTLRSLKIWHRLKPRIVMGENIGQTFGLVATGNASVGFVARSQLQSKLGKALQGRRWDVPSHLHDPVRQDAILLKRAKKNEAAKGFLIFLKGPKARAIMAKLGYQN